KAKCTQLHPVASHVSGPQVVAATSSTTCPSAWNRIETWFRAGSAANTLASRVTVTTSSGEAKGADTEPMLDAKERAAAGMTLQEANAGDDALSRSATRANAVTRQPTSFMTLSSSNSRATTDRPARRRFTSAAKDRLVVSRAALKVLVACGTGLQVCQRAPQGRPRRGRVGFITFSSGGPPGLLDRPPRGCARTRVRPPPYVGQAKKVGVTPVCEIYRRVVRSLSSRFTLRCACRHPWRRRLPVRLRIGHRRSHAAVVVARVAQGGRHRSRLHGLRRQGVPRGGLECVAEPRRGPGERLGLAHAPPLRPSHADRGGRRFRVMRRAGGDPGRPV